MDDWRIDNVRRLEGLRFQCKPCDWACDTRAHDHDAACRASFAELTTSCVKVMRRADYEHRADYDWICPTGFAGLTAMRRSEAARRLDRRSLLASIQ